MSAFDDLVTMAGPPRIDRIDGKGNIREHIVRTPVHDVEDLYTLCGLPIVESQNPAGNAICLRCEQLERIRRRAKAKEDLTVCTGCGVREEATPEQTLFGGLCGKCDAKKA